MAKLVDEVAQADVDPELNGVVDLTESDDQYSIASMAEMLESGAELDQEFILGEVQQLLAHCANEFQEHLLPVLCKVCPSWGAELQFKTAQTLSYLVACSIPPESAKLVIFACVNILKGGTPLVGDERTFFFQIWSGILVEAMQLPDLDLREDELQAILTLASSNAKHPKMECRKAAARIHGALATVLDPERVSSIVLPDMLNLFYDNNITVLGASIEAMVNIAGALPSDVVDKRIWPRLMNLTDSEDARIRCSALRTVAQILASIRKRAPTQPLRASFQDTTAALLKREVKAIKQDAQEDLRIISDDKYMVLEVQSDIFGELVYNTCDVLDPPTVKDIFRAYALMASCNGPLLRRNVAYNFPGIALAMSDRHGDISAALELLSRDKDDEVRWNLSAGIHESVRILLEVGKVERFSGVVLTLLTDENPAVSLNVVEHFAEILQLLQRIGAMEEVRKLVSGLKGLKGMVEGSWRVQRLIVTQLIHSMRFIDENTIAGVVLPMLWKHIEEGMPPVRAIAARTIMHALRNIADKDLFNSSYKTYYTCIPKIENTYRIRLTLIDAALEGLEVFSSLFFRDFFAKALIELAEDPVSNVRVKFVLFAHKFAPPCADLPDFQKLLSLLLEDEDDDVRLLMGSYGDKARAEKRNFSTDEVNRADYAKVVDERKFYGKRSDINSLFITTGGKVPGAAAGHGVSNDSNALNRLKMTEMRGSFRRASLNENLLTAADRIEHNVSEEKHENGSTDKQVRPKTATRGTRSAGMQDLAIASPGTSKTSSTSGSSKSNSDTSLSNIVPAQSLLEVPSELSSVYLVRMETFLSKVGLAEDKSKRAAQKAAKNHGGTLAGGKGRSKGQYSTKSLRSESPITSASSSPTGSQTSRPTSIVSRIRTNASASKFIAQKEASEPKVNGFTHHQKKADNAAPSLAVHPSAASMKGPDLTVQESPETQAEAELPNPVSSTTTPVTDARSALSIWGATSTSPAPGARPATPTPSARPTMPTPSARPTTPTPNARPTTPTPSARPTTPTPSARPTTPTPGARPTTPTPGARPATPTAPGARPASLTPGAQPALLPPGDRPVSPSPDARPTSLPQGAKSTLPASGGGPTEPAPVTRPASPASDAIPALPLPGAISASPGARGRTSSAPKGRTPSPTPRGRPSAPAPRDRTSSPVLKVTVPAPTLRGHAVSLTPRAEALPTVSANASPVTETMTLPTERRTGAHAPKAAVSPDLINLGDSTAQKKKRGLMKLLSRK